MKEHILVGTFKGIERLVFFDIDSTLSSSLEFCKPTARQRVDDTQALLERMDVTTVHAIDAFSLNETSLWLLSEMVSVPGTKAICVSSWMNYKTEETLDAVDAIFRLKTKFPDQWLIGGIACNAHQRIKVINSFIADSGFKGQWVLIDDDNRTVSDASNFVHVDGRLGFTVYNLQEAMAILDSPPTTNDKLNFHLDSIEANTQE